MFPGPLGISLAGQARDAGIWSLDTIQIRDFGLGKHRQVDDTPAGGGAGMVLRADVLGPALDHARTRSPDAPLIYLSPRGTPLTQSLARDLAEGPGVTLLAGRFEGVDERVIDAKGLKEISIGDYVLAGGELAAMVLIEACVRLLPGVVGAAESLANESFETGLLEHPQYTKPRELDRPIDPGRFALRRPQKDRGMAPKGSRAPDGRSPARPLAAPRPTAKVKAANTLRLCMARISWANTSRAGRFARPSLRERRPATRVTWFPRARCQSESTGDEECEGSSSGVLAGCGTGQRRRLGRPEAVPNAERAGGYIGRDRNRQRSRF